VGTRKFDKYNATARKPMVSAQTFFFEEVVQGRRRVRLAARD